MDHIVRILTTGKPLEVIDQGIVDAIHTGSRVLVKAGSPTANSPEINSSEIDSSEINQTQKLDSENSAIASWAENLPQQHGPVWQRVGPDVLFTRTLPEILRKS